MSHSDRMLDRYGFPGPVTPQVPQNRVRQTYRGLPGAGLGCGDCALPPDHLGALPAGAFVGAIAMLAGLKRYTPGTMPPEIAVASGLSKGGGGGQHHGGGGHGHGHHGRGRGGRGGGSWWGVPGGYYGGDTYIVEERDPCPIGYLWDPVNLRCVKAPPVILRGLQGLGSTATDWCTALRTGSAAASAFSSLCNMISDPTQKAICQASFRAAQAGVSTGCAHVDDPSGGTLPAAVAVNAADSLTARMDLASNPALFQAPAAQSKAFTETPTGKAVVYGGIALAAVGVAALLFRR